MSRQISLTAIDSIDIIEIFWLLQIKINLMKRRLSCVHEPLDFGQSAMMTSPLIEVSTELITPSKCQEENEMRRKIEFCFCVGGR